MTTKKTNSYIDQELKWVEEKLASMKKYVDDNPIDTMVDRTITLDFGKYTKEVVTAKIEEQIKSVTATLKEITIILEAVNKLREKEETRKLQARGADSSIPHLMR